MTELKETLRRLCMAAGAGGLDEAAQTALLRVELCQNLLGCIRHEGLQQGCADGDGLYQVVEYRCQTVFLSLVLSQCPRHGLVDIFVAATEDVENLGDGICHTKLVHLALCLLYRCQNDIL